VHPVDDLSTSAGFLALRAFGSRLTIGGEAPYVVCSSKDDVKLYDHATRTVKTLGKQKSVSGLSISAAGKFAASVGDDGTLNIYSLETRK
jgi:WD40 repeat protein